MNRQYIGARYVPKFAEPTEWVQGMAYEALTIVTYNFASYTSKIPVPPTVGNPADNNKYWALTGNYNAQVEEYRQEVEQLLNSYHKSVKTVTVVNDIATDDKIVVGDFVQTSGFYTPFDFGAALYEIVDGTGNYSLQIGNKFARIIHNGTVNIAQYGAGVNKISETTAALKWALNDRVKKILIPPLNYTVNQGIDIVYSCTIEGMDERNSRISLDSTATYLFNVGTSDVITPTFKNLILWDLNGNPVNNASSVRSNSIASAIKSSASVRGRFINVKINQFNKGFDMNNTGYSNDYERCELHDCNYGISHNINANAVNVDSCGFDKCVVGCEINDGLGNFNIIQSQFENCLIGCRFESITQVNVLENYFDNNYLSDIVTKDNVSQIFIKRNLSICRNIATLYNLPTSGLIAVIEENHLHNAGNTNVEVYRGSSPNEKVVYGNNTLVGTWVITPNNINISNPLETKNVYDYTTISTYLGEGNQTAKQVPWQRISGSGSKTITLPALPYGTHIDIILDIANGSTITLSTTGEIDGESSFLASKQTRVILDAWQISNSGTTWLVKWID